MKFVVEQESLWVIYKICSKSCNL